jgi:preprotein translocase subunit SecG
MGREKRGSLLSIFSAFRVYFQVAQIVVAVALIISILLQARGAGLGSVFGGTGTVFKTRRGIEKTIFKGTVVLAILFAILSFMTAAIPPAP